MFDSDLIGFSENESLIKYVGFLSEYVMYTYMHGSNYYPY
jgi:hypothetical protein